MGRRTHVELGRRADLGADCSSCFGLCCVALAFVKSSDFPQDKAAGEPCEHLDGDDACSIHSDLRDRGYKGCTVFDCFGAGQKVSQHTFAGRSWREDPQVGAEMFAAFPVVRRLHELLWYLGEAIDLVEADSDGSDPSPWVAAFDEVRRLADLAPHELADVDVDAVYGSARGLLMEASEIARAGGRSGGQSGAGRTPGPGSDLIGAKLDRSDLTGATLRGSVAIAADLSGADLRRCDVLGVDLRDADLRGADLSTAIYLTQMQVNSARGDARTALPDGFERPSHWTA